MTALKFFLSPEAKEAGVCFQPPRPGDAGFDLRAAAELLLSPGARGLVATGLYVAIPAGWVGIIKDRSSLAARGLYTHAGVIDAAYRGELKVVVSNGGAEDIRISVGAKFAQLLVVPCLTEGREVAALKDLGDTARGAGGFGSTGI